MGIVVTPDALNDLMEFDHVIIVAEDGTVSEPTGVYAPETVIVMESNEVEIDGPWTLLSGYSGQYSYSGPVMHPSEYIGGRLAEDILSTPGTYVAVLVFSDYARESEPDGWAIARMTASDPC